MTFFQIDGRTYEMNCFHNFTMIKIKNRNYSSSRAFSPFQNGFIFVVLATLLPPAYIWNDLSAYYYSHNLNFFYRKHKKLRIFPSSRALHFSNDD